MLTDVLSCACSDRSLMRHWSLPALPSSGLPAPALPPPAINLTARSSDPVRVPFAAADHSQPAVTAFGAPLNCATWPALLTVAPAGDLFLADETAACVTTEPGYIVLRNVPEGGSPK